MVDKVVSLDQRRKERADPQADMPGLLPTKGTPRMQCPCGSVSFMLVPGDVLEGAPKPIRDGLVVACEACGKVILSATPQGTVA